VLCPYAAGVGSTVGFLAAPLAFDFVRSAYALLERVDWEGVNGLYAEMEGEGRRLLSASGVPAGAVVVQRTADMRLSGQAHQIAVPIPGGHLDEASTPAVRAAFEEVYRAHYKRTCPGVPVEAISWRVHVSGPPPAFTLRHDDAPPPGARSSARGEAAGEAAGAARKGERPVYFPETGGFTLTPVYDRYRLLPGARFAGPAVVEERESTAVVGPGADVRVDASRTLIIRLPSRSPQAPPVPGRAH
jgi:N-methylhydantoinase A/oxoprolinase/acetone carboxylase beta subunit